MPAPSFPFDPVSDAEITAGKPAKQSQGRRLRDDGYAKLPDCGVTQETDTTLVLKPDGSGGVEWAAAFDTKYDENNSGDSSVTGLSAGLWEFSGYVQLGSPLDKATFSGLVKVASSRIEHVEGVARTGAGAVTVIGDITTTSFNLVAGATLTYGSGTLSTNSASRSWLRATRVG